MRRGLIGAEGWGQGDASPCSSAPQAPWSIYTYAMPGIQTHAPQKHAYAYYIYFPDDRAQGSRTITPSVASTKAQTTLLISSSQTHQQPLAREHHHTHTHTRSNTTKRAGPFCIDTPPPPCESPWLRYLNPA